MKSKELELSIKKFKQASERLSELLHTDVKEDVLRDAMIQRFEFTYELCWKTFKIYLSEKGIENNNPRDCFKNAFKDGLIEAVDEQVFLEILKDRNLTSHVYQEKIAEDIYKRIRANYISVFEKIVQRLEK